MLLGILRQLANQHDRHPPGIVLQGHLPLVVIHVAILVDLIELKMIPLCLMNSLYVGINSPLAIFDQPILKNKMDKPMTQLHLGQNHL